MRAKTTRDPTLAANPPEARFAPELVFDRIRSRLSLEPECASRESLIALGEAAPNEPGGDPLHFSGARPAAVLVGLVDHPGQVSVILTLRAAALRAHSGQIAFPGGKIDAQDESPIAAALREAHEEIGLDRGRVEPLGYLDPLWTGTGFRILPVVAKVTPPLALEINFHEVAEAFEVPFAFLMDAANHFRGSREFAGKIRHFYAMPYGERYIWGATAGILRNLYERLYG
ncbi:CoA pyrophosphatase [Methylocapsa acidiphila]|uniref:CoA pyrophosphatase n=1 Tax=Methylocapsa acidiphila TaxID=133552 RepID=UPI0006864931|nr:CoA pyrophosphatase [Methylocapsa acidiphila]